MKLYKILATFLLIFSTTSLHAQTIEEIKDKINDRTDTIKQLEAEIKNFQTQIEGLGKQADTLKNTLASLDLSKKKIEADLALTQNKIENTSYEIQQLSLQIDDKNSRIGDGRRVIAQSMTSISQTDSFSLLEKLLGSGTLAQAWNGAEELITLQADVKDRIQELQSIKTSLMDNKKKTEQKKSELVSLKSDLASKKAVLAATVKEQNDLLSTTKNTESNYKKIVAEKAAQKIAFEKELFLYESALKIAIDASLYAPAHKGILSWPLDKVVITQYFGKTVDSIRLYVSGTHGGMDFGASIGTPVRAALGGVITDTEAVRSKSGCQYGKFVLIKHPNGLSTLYGHLSLVNVSPGESVSTGQVIGYSGNTGYATGPHLHFGVYATQGVRVVNASSVGSKNCAGIKTVTSPLNGYLDPMLYL